MSRGFIAVINVVSLMISTTNNLLIRIIGMGLILIEGLGSITRADNCCVFGFDNNDIKEEDQPLDIGDLIKSIKK